MINRIDKNELKSILDAQKVQALDSLQQREEAVKPVTLDQSKVGRLSRIDAMQQQAMAVAALNNTRNQLQRIESTLQRLEHDKNYGYCIKCDNEIEWSRLKINPSLLLCRPCMDISRS